MKKIITTICLALSINLSAQSLEIASATPSTICPGDSLTVKYKFASGNNLQINLVGPNHGQIWQYNYAYLSSQPSVTTGTETIYTIKLKIDATIGNGFGYIYNPYEAKQLTLDMRCGVETGIIGLSESLPGLSVFPNPGKGLFTVILKNPINNTQLKIYNSQGILIKEQLVIFENSIINLIDTPAGIYFLYIIGDGVPPTIAKIIKE